MAIAIRKWLKNKIPAPKKCGWLVDQSGYNDGHDVNQVDMQHVVEHRDAPEYEQYSSQFALCLHSVKRRQRNQSRTESHQ